MKMDPSSRKGLEEKVATHQGEVEINIIIASKKTYELDGTPKESEERKIGDLNGEETFPFLQGIEDLLGD